VDPGGTRQCFGSPTQPDFMAYMYITPSSQCDNFQMVLRSLTVKGTQISNSQVEVVAGGGAKEVRFLFFLPLPTGPLLGS